jgi:hypothetical protein
MTTATANQIRFRWVSSYLNIVDYDVYGDGSPYRIETRRAINRFNYDYQRSIFNGTEAEWQRDVIGAIDLLFRSHHTEQALPQTVVDAFNAWRAAEHAQQIAHIKAHPEKYGDLDENDPLFEAPPVVRGAQYVISTGWVVSETAQAAA